jgi:hypothetical protein
MKMKYVYLGMILLIITYFTIDNRLNKEYNDCKIIKVKDNELIILKRNDYYGILIFENQTKNPQKATYKWLLSKNNIIRLDDKSSYLSGKGITGDDVVKGKLTPVEFGTFKFYWSPNKDSKGFVYLNYYPDVNEQNGSLFWTISTNATINDSTLIKAESKFQILSIRRKNIISWLFLKD